MKRISSILILWLLFISITGAQDLVIGTYNVRCDAESDRKQGDGWEQRAPILSQQIRFNDFDIVGTQEVRFNQLNDLLKYLPEYAYIGVGRDDGKNEGEFVPIFYKKDRFKLLQSGNFWLSENTESPNKGWDAALPRICTWGEFKDLKKKKKIWFFNIHFDHVGKEARKQSAILLLNKIKEMCGKKDVVILTGDFNVDQTNESYKLLATSDILNDTYETAIVRYALNGTFNSFKNNRLTNSRIDHIFISNNLKADRYGILTDSYRTPKNNERLDPGNFPKEVYAFEADARMISDHFPIKVTLYYKK